jgi:hypothetical protein
MYSSPPHLHAQLLQRSVTGPQRLLLRLAHALVLGGKVAVEVNVVRVELVRQVDGWLRRHVLIHEAVHGGAHAQARKVLGAAAAAYRFSAGWGAGGEEMLLLFAFHLLLTCMVALSRSAAIHVKSYAERCITHTHTHTHVRPRWQACR